ncbi:MAG: galactokinase [Oscillospiraceae bacterium]|jgi:galactokinase|nr:galactokinase [Oscillospiraceae bacterium]
MISVQLTRLMESSRVCGQFQTMYGSREGAIVSQVERYTRVAKRFGRLFPDGARCIRFFSAPGRIEIGGNHTDHNHGMVLAAAISLDAVAAAAPNGTSTARVCSEGFNPVEVDLNDLAPRESELRTTAAVVRGVLARLRERGIPIEGFDATISSGVKTGSGLSSSAAFEVLLLTMTDSLFGGGQLDAKTRARIAQNVENTYFGKPSGLMDQMASSVGGLVWIDFRGGDAQVTPISYDFAHKGYAIVVVNPGGGHADLNDEYASIPYEMKSVAALFGQETLRGIRVEQVESSVASLRERGASDRAILRALHYFDENQRVAEQARALERDDLPRFLELIVESGESSWKLLQNVYARRDSQSLALALEIARRFLSGHGAWRVHGGGFEGTILCFVPTDKLGAFVRRMNGVFGDHCCDVLDIRAIGAAEIVD